MALKDKASPDMKKKYPFLLGTTSYIVPDDIIPNVRMLSPIVDDIELVLFESPAISNIPTESDIHEITSIADSTGCGFTVHLPTDRKAGSAQKRERELFIDDARRIIHRCMPLQPRAWIVHLEGIEKTASIEDIAAWELRCAEVIEELCMKVGEPSQLAVENLGYPWYWHLGIAAQAGTSLCCDIGHLWLHYPECWKEHLSAMLPETRVIHLHGVSDEKDHLSLARNEKHRLKEFVELLMNYQYKGIVTFEIFSEKDFNESEEVFNQLWEQLS
jgi:sugar phosphate isomerase/epimerase